MCIRDSTHTVQSIQLQRHKQKRNIQTFLKVMETKAEYLLLQPLGDSSHASSFLAYNCALQRFAALKIFKTSSNPFTFIDECRTHERLMTLQVSRIPRLLNYSSDLSLIKNLDYNDALQGFMEMEFGELGDLASFFFHLSKFPTDSEIPEHIIKYCFWEIVNAIEEFHSRRIAHMDIKPQNIIVEADMSLKLIDFGLTTPVPLDGLVGGGKGTPGFMAPECMQPYCDGCKVDVFAVGASLVKILNVYNKPLRASEACASLIYGMTHEDHVKRLSIGEVRRHKWFSDVPSKAEIQSELAEILPQIYFLRKDSIYSFSCPQSVKEIIIQTLYGNASLSTYDTSSFFDQVIQNEPTCNTSYPEKPRNSDAMDIESD
eukprot:TRINITY_DN30869_c0_g1_i1.p1 TRINITY_DN30869_c0_g1~~TRINITY_DN30869_c0_g1_i1.p1  ORF type:complete len:373 (+),score=65.31 TRINITY_DN30869_c0_g1_i1:65-1183(+)